MNSKVTAIELLNNAAKLLATRGIETARLDAEVLLAHLMGISRIELYTKSVSVNENLAHRFETLIEKRLNGCPVAYITGVKEFWSIPIKVTPDVMIPRPETELIVEQALKFCPLPDPLPQGEREEITGFEVLDLCCGSGCISAALATELPHAKFTLADKSQKALEVAQENLASASGRVKFLCGDLFKALGISTPPLPSPYKGEGLFDLIVSNPPYVPLEERDSLSREILEYEPQMAIFGGKDGLDFIRQIVEDAPKFLKTGGRLIMEIGFGQAEQVKEIAKQTGKYKNFTVHKDLAGIERAATAIRR